MFCLFLSLFSKSCPTLVTPWTVACQAALSMGFFRQDYWSGLPFPSPGDLPKPGIKPGSPALKAGSLLSYEGSRIFQLWKWEEMIFWVGPALATATNKWSQGVYCHIQRDSIVYYLSIIYFCLMFFALSGSDEFGPSDIIYILILYGNNHNLYGFRWMSL